MILIDENGGSTSRQPLLNADCLRHSNRDIPHPFIAVKSDRSYPIGVVIAVCNKAVAHHCATKKLGSCILFRLRKFCHPGGLRDLCEDTAMRVVMCLFDPPNKCQ